MALRFKGQAFLGFLSTLRDLHGEDAYRRVVAGLPPPFARAVESREIVPMGWYASDWYAAMHASARSVCGTGVSRTVGREAAVRDMNTIYRYVMKFLSPETLLGQAPRIFGLFCEGGKCTVSGVTSSSARILYSDCAGATRGMWELVIGGTELMIELSGGKRVSSKVMSGGTDRDATMIVHYDWSR